MTPPIAQTAAVQQRFWAGLGPDAQQLGDWTQCRNSAAVPPQDWMAAALQTAGLTAEPLLGLLGSAEVRMNNWLRGPPPSPAGPSSA